MHLPAVPRCVVACLGCTRCKALSSGLMCSSRLRLPTSAAICSSLLLESAFGSCWHVGALPNRLPDHKPSRLIHRCLHRPRVHLTKHQLCRWSLGAAGAYRPATSSTGQRWKPSASGQGPCCELPRRPMASSLPAGTPSLARWACARLLRVHVTGSAGDQPFAACLNLMRGCGCIHVSWIAAPSPLRN